MVDRYEFFYSMGGYHTTATKLGGGGILESPCLSVRLSVHKVKVFA